MSEHSLTALDLVPEAVVIVDAAHVITHHNARAGALLGLSDAVGTGVLDALRLEDDAGNPWGEGLFEVGSTADRLAEHVLRVVLPDGRRRPVAMAGSVLDDGLLLTFRSAGRREHLDRARSDLVATVSHEIRSPLSSVKGFTRTLLMKWDRFDDAQKRTMLETINEDADRVTRLLTELLDVSRIDTGRVELHREPVDPAEVVGNVLDKVAHRPEGDGREIRLHSDGDAPRIRADPDKLEQIVTNLIENALRYARDSEVRVRLEAQDGEGVHLTVADDGPGIPPEHHRRVFQKFGRGRDAGSGTGLGLYITQGLVKAHGGRVWVDSEEGEGATFHVELPVDRRSAGGAPDG